MSTEEAKLRSRRVFVLTGAGLSAESGLATFRNAPNALWSRYRPEELATPEAFAADPAAVHAFYNARRQAIQGVEPNAAHRAIARLGEGLRAQGGALFVCTQNVDDLHERAGSAEVVHMHGQLLQVRCTRCQAVQSWRDSLSTQTTCPACGAVGGMRPNVVWFGEVPLHMERITEELESATLFVAIGTSGSVYPAAGFVAEARARQVPTCELNLEPSDQASKFDSARYGLATQVVPAWVDDVLAACPQS